MFWVWCLNIKSNWNRIFHVFSLSLFHEMIWIWHWSFSYLRSRVCRVERSGGDLGCLSVLVPEAAWGELKQRKNEKQKRKLKQRKNEEKNLCFPCFCLAPILFAHPPNHSIACKDFFLHITHVLFFFLISYHTSLFIRFQSRMKGSNF